MPVRDRSGAWTKLGGGLTYLELAAGFIYLLMGGDLLVRGAVALARRLDVPQVVVAATVVGFGTSLPEMVVSLQASLAGVPDLILGNVVGSNVANVLLVGGAAAVVCPLAHDDRQVGRNVGVMFAALLAFTAIAAMGPIGPRAGLLLLTGFVIVMATTVRSTVLDRQPVDVSTPLDWVLGIPTHISMISLFVVTGVVMLPLGAKLLVDAAVEIAVSFSVPETVVGLTVLAIGTSLPELTTTVLAAMERRSDVAIGAIVGSNTFNVLAIMGLTASLSPTPIVASDRLLWLDMPVMLATSGALGLAAWKIWPIGRPVGVAMLLAYVAYLGTLYILV